MGSIAGSADGVAPVSGPGFVRVRRVAALAAAVVLAVSACGGADDEAPPEAAARTTEPPERDPDEDTEPTPTTDEVVATTASTASPTTTAPGEPSRGGELVDLGTFVGGPPLHIDPALNSTIDAYQVVNALYDGLTDVDTTDPANPVVVPLVAESFVPNADASVWTFVIRADAQFSNGEPILPSSFQRAWDRASDPAFAGDYSYLFNYIDGGSERLAGRAPSISGVAVDDASRTLTVTLAAPYSGFAAMAGFEIFSPMPSAVEGLRDQGDWENGLMVGNGPFMLDAPRTDEEIVLVRNDNWQGDIFGNTQALLDRITFRTSPDVDTAYNAFEAGEGDTAVIPPGRFSEANDNYATTSDVAIAAVYFYDFNMANPLVGGPQNVLLRQAISQAIDRETINELIFDGSRALPTGVTPPGIPGYVPDLCLYCTYDPEAAQAAFDAWTAAGNALPEPLPIQFNAGVGHEEVVDLIVADLAAIGIPAVADGRPTETYFASLADGECVFCRAGWFADYLTYDNFMYDLFHSDAIGGNNYSQFDNPAFDALVGQALATTDPVAAGQLFNAAEDILLNRDIAVVPINFYRGDYVYNPDRIANFVQTAPGLVLWEQVSLRG
jgi:oligopeptide transport system substrate-binding protein